MDNYKQIWSESETPETLEAASSALNYAMAHFHSVELFEVKENTILASLVHAVSEINAAKMSHDSVSAVKGHVSNAVARTRDSLKAMQDMRCEEGALVIIIRATARALLLLYPLIQTEGPILLVARKKRKSRRRTPIILERPSPRFEVMLGSNTETNFFAGFSGDISSGGLFIATYDIYPIGTRIKVKARLPRGRILCEETKVKWIREYNEAAPDIAPGMGVVFRKLNSGDHRIIERFMSRREAIFYEAV